ncbi:hypothetical protein AMTRI_Chr05g64410 [Amborella trichopoda]
MLDTVCNISIYLAIIWGMVCERNALNMAKFKNSAWAQDSALALAKLLPKFESYIYQTDHKKMEKYICGQISAPSREREIKRQDVFLPPSREREGESNRYIENRKINLYLHSPKHKVASQLMQTSFLKLVTEKEIKKGAEICRVSFYFLVPVSEYSTV